MSRDPFGATLPCVATAQQSREQAHRIRVRSQAVRQETQRLRRFAAWHYRLRIAGGSRAPTTEVVEELGAGRKPKVVKFRPKKTKEDQITDALAASLAGMKKKRGARG